MPQTDPDKPVRCGRCDFKGSREDRDAHAVDAGHPLCAICRSRSLRPTETTVCDPCVARTRDQLDEIVDTVVNRAGQLIHYSGYYGLFGADLLVMTADGSLEGGGPDDWITDPTPVIAVLEANERDWRRHFGEPPAEQMATIVGCAGYLKRNLGRAAAEHPDFDDFVSEIRTLYTRLLHTAGLIDDPERAPAECFSCGGRLIRAYRPPRVDPKRRLERVKRKVNDSAKRRKEPTDPKERRAMVAAAVTGRNDEGLADRFECFKCGTTYTFAQYGLALRTRSDKCQGWVELKLAAEVSRTPYRTIQTWVNRLRVTASCPWRPDLPEHERRTVVWWPDVQEQTLLATERRRMREARRAEKQAVA